MCVQSDGPPAVGAGSGLLCWQGGELQAAHHRGAVPHRQAQPPSPTTCGPDSGS